MTRIIPHQTVSKVVIPSWLNAQELVNVSREELERNNQFRKEASSHTPSTIVAQYACPTCQKVIGADNAELGVQEDLAKRASQAFKPTCPVCQSSLIPYKSVPTSSVGTQRQGDMTQKDTDFAHREGTYNTYVDRHMVYKAVNALQDYASQNGMQLAHVRYLKAEHTKQAGQEYPMLNNIECEIQWKTTPKVSHTVTATIGIDQAGMAKMPTMMTLADKQTVVPFTKESVQAIGEKYEFDHMPEMKHKRTDMATYKSPDISRFRAMASQTSNDTSSLVDELVESSKKKVSGIDKEADAMTPGVPPPVQPTSPVQYTPMQQIVNPVDGKTYTVKQQSNTGITVTDPLTQAESIIPVDQMANVRPAVKTTSFSVQSIVDELLGETNTSSLLEQMKRDFLEGQHDEKYINDIKNATTIEELRNILDAGGDPNYTDEMINQYGVANLTRNSLQKTASTQKFAASTRPLLTHVSHMSHDWAELRKGMKTKSQLDKEAKDIGYDAKGPQKDKTGHDVSGVPFSEEKEIEIGMTEFPKDQKKEDSNKEGKGYKIPFKKMDENQVEEREEFDNKQRLHIPSLQWKDLMKMVDGKEPDENLGLNRVEKTALLKAVGMSKKADVFGEPQEDFNYSGELSLQDFISTVFTPAIDKFMLTHPEHAQTLNEILKSPTGKTGFAADVQKLLVGKYERFDRYREDQTYENSGNILQSVEKAIEEALSEVYKYHPQLKGNIPLASQKFAEVEDVSAGSTTYRKDKEGKEDTLTELPIQHKEIKTAPKIKEFTEPAAIEPAGGKLKEAITKWNQVKTEIDSIKTNMQAKVGPLETAVSDARVPFVEQQGKLAKELSTYMQLVWSKLGETEDRIAAYENSILARVERQIETGGKASLTELLAEVEKKAPEILAKLSELKVQIENTKVQKAVERLLYEYPISKSHEKKVKASADSFSFDEIVSTLVGWVDTLSEILDIIPATVTE